MNDCCEPDIAVPEPPPTGAEADAALARLARGLAHPARVKIVRLLAERDRCHCGEIVESFDLAQSTVSQHLKVLKEAGLVRGEVEGPATCYCLSRAGLELAGRLVGALAGGPQSVEEELATAEAAVLSPSGPVHRSDRGVPGRGEANGQRAR